MMRSHYCGQLNESLDGQEVTLCGWVHRRRDHGGVIFLDVRDREGLAQVVFDPDRAETFAKADRVRSEFVVKITGKVRLRPEGARNPNMGAEPYLPGPLLRPAAVAAVVQATADGRRLRSLLPDRQVLP